MARLGGFVVLLIAFLRQIVLDALLLGPQALAGHFKKRLGLLLQGAYSGLQTD